MALLVQIWSGLIAHTSNNGWPFAWSFFKTWSSLSISEPRWRNFVGLLVVLIMILSPADDASPEVEWSWLLPPSTSAPSARVPAAVPIPSASCTPAASLTAPGPFSADSPPAPCPESEGMTEPRPRCPWFLPSVKVIGDSSANVPISPAPAGAMLPALCLCTVPVDGLFRVQDFI